MIKTSVPLCEAAGKHISHFCPFGLGKENSQNHCAHFVGHMLGYEFGATCKNRTSAEKKRAEKGACIRVNEIFDRLRDTGLWVNRPAHLSCCLIFVTHASNVVKTGDRSKMHEHPAKHIGIYVHGSVWHYSNTSDIVVQDSEAMFMQKFRHAYHAAGQTVEYYYGTFL
jgi:hypothetical protein